MKSTMGASGQLARPSRAKIVEYLSHQGGSVASASGRGLTSAMAAAVGYRDPGALNAMLARLDREGVIAREVRGRRTYSITLRHLPVHAVAHGNGNGHEATAAQLRRFADELVSPRGMVRAALLLLLGERPSHGFDLNERLKPLGLGAEDPSPVYRALHWLEESELLQSSWQIQDSGPARRVYALTPVGRQALELAAASLKERSGALDRHLTRCLVEPAERSRQEDHPFEVLLEAKVAVMAPDKQVARRKAEAALSRGRALGADVTATGQVWVYDATSAVQDSHSTDVA